MRLGRIAARQLEGPARASANAASRMRTRNSPRPVAAAPTTTHLAFLFANGTIDGLIQVHPHEPIRMATLAADLWWALLFLGQLVCIFASEQHRLACVVW